MSSQKVRLHRSRWLRPQREPREGMRGGKARSADSANDVPSYCPTPRDEPLTADPISVTPETHLFGSPPELLTFVVGPLLIRPHRGPLRVEANNVCQENPIHRHRPGARGDRKSVV